MEAIFNMFKVKYVKLDELIMRHCKEINPDSRVNLFINLEPILRKLASANVEEYLRVKSDDKSLEMISCIINLAAHYRLFFTKNKLYSRIYMYLSYPFKTSYKNRMINPNYRKAYEHKFTKDSKTIVLTKTLDAVLPFVKTILEYVEGVYLIGADSIESSLVPQVITKEFPTNHINFILSSDKYDYQYVNKGFYIIRPKQDESYMVTQENLIDNIKLEEKIVTDISVGTNFYPFILSLLGDKYRNIEKIKKIGLSGILKMLNKALQENIIGKDVSNINILSKIVREEYRPLVLSNFYCIDIDTQMQMLNVKDIYDITKQIVDKFDNVSLKKINDEYFRHYPIYLLELTDANKLLKKKKRTNVFI